MMWHVVGVVGAILVAVLWVVVFEVQAETDCESEESTA
jgi:hypothetical protein